VPAIRITDEMSAVVEVHPDPLSLAATYFRNPAELRLLGVNLTGLRSLPLKDARVQSLQAGISMEKPLPVAIDNTELALGAGASGHFSVTQEGGSPFDDVFDDPVRVQPGEACVSLGWSATVSAGAGFPAGALKFGLDAKSEARCMTHRVLKADTPFGEALACAVKSYAIPGDVGDLHQMETGAVATIEGSGSLEFSANAKMAASTSLLATSAIGDVLMSAVPGGLDVAAGGKVSVTASFKVSCEYQVRVVKSGPNTVSLGFYRRKGRGVSSGVKVSSGVSPALGGMDLLEPILRVVTGRPDVREADLRRAGMSEAQLDALKAAVRKSVQRKLEASLEFLAARDHASSQAIVFDVRLDQIDGAGVDAIADALAGNLTPLTAGARPPKGISRRRTIDIDIDETVTSLRVNLFGVLNYSSVSRLLLKSYTAVDENGDLIIVDKASADHTRLTIHNLVPQPDRLRVLRMESFLISAAYAAMPGAPAVAVEHSYFHRSLKTSRSALKDHLDVAEALGLLDDKAALLEGYREGAQSLAVEFALAAEDVPSLFAEGSVVGYDRVARQALAALLEGDESGRHRLLPARDDALWAAMRERGSAGAIFSLDAFRGLSVAQKEAIYADYRRCVWWADSMASLAEVIGRMRALKGPADPKFAALRRQLGLRMKAVARDTGDHFGDPWGLVAMDMASGRRGRVRVRITGESVNYERARAAPGLESAARVRRPRAAAKRRAKAARGR